MHQIIQELQQLQHQARQIAQECQSLQNRLQMVTGDVQQEENRRQSQQQFGQTRSYGSSQYGGMNTAGSYGAQYQPTSQYQTASQYQPTSQFGTMGQQRGSEGQSNAAYTGGTHIQGTSYSVARSQSPQFQASTTQTASQYQGMSNRGSASSVSPSSLQAVLQADSSFSSQSSNLRQSEQPSYRRSI